ncbi:MAG TPA: bifunctional diguanylate cyclase/phosphodiesterase [Acidimicrobiales bacterium]|nr:bifunctional diguanylate cyclase/phosphodiesterase [Acidimicrobiales bacterium]
MSQLTTPDSSGREEGADVRRRASASAAFRLGLLAVLVGGLAALVAATWLPVVSESTHRLALQWWYLAAGFTAAELLPVHLEIRRHTWSTTLTAVPLVIGLVYSVPLAVVLGQLLGCVMAWGIIRRQAVHKLAFNAATAALEASLAVAVYHALAGTRAVVDPRIWMAVVLAVLVEEIVSSMAVFLALLCLSGSRPPSLVSNFLPGATVSSTSTVLVIGGLIVVRVQPYAAGLLAVITAVVALGYYELTAVRRRYAGLQMLYSFTQAMQQSKRPSDIVQNLLAVTRELLGSEIAELTLRDEQGKLGMHVLDGETYSTSESDQTPAWIAVAESPDGLLATNGTRERLPRSWLEAQGWTDGMLAPLVRNGETIGTMAVGNREAKIATFDRENLKLFVTLAGHAAVSLENYTLIDQLEWEASHDTLTGLGNRRQFYRDLALALRERQPGTKLAVALVDLDRFKEINDTFGHHTGDMYLKWLAQRFKSEFPPGVTATRLGGDEFAFFVAYEGTAEEARSAIEKILRPLWSQPFAIGEVDVVMSASTGVSVAPDHAEDAITLLQRADVAMYLAKEDHGGITLYSTERDTYSPRRLGLASALRSAIEQGQLMVVFQPKLDLVTGRIDGAEALVRWQHPTEGLVFPDQFIPIAERTGLIVPLTNVVLDQALARCAEWHKTLPGLGVAVNLSVTNLADPGLIDSVKSILARHQVPSECLTLEVTETQIMENQKVNAAVLEELAQLGVSISVDDFGTGYSSLAYLSRLPVNQLKVDRSFVGMMDVSPNDAAIVRSVIELGRTLGISVVAEGVETKSKLETLVELGCTDAQGYYIGAPMSSDDFLTMAKEWKMERVSTVHSPRADARTKLHAV